MEYTDEPEAESADQPFSTPTPATGLLETAEGQASDMVAVALSVVPGLGHIYKGYRVIGLLLIFIGTPMALGIALLIATGTAGFGFFLLPIYWDRSHGARMGHSRPCRARVERRRRAVLSYPNSYWFFALESEQRTLSIASLLT